MYIYILICIYAEKGRYASEVVEARGRFALAVEEVRIYYYLYIHIRICVCVCIYVYIAIRRGSSRSKRTFRTRR